MNVIKISAKDLAYQSYGEYAKYVNLHRAIPSIGDGLIPVYRRVLLAAKNYGDWTLSNSIVADTCRDYHGHGSASVEPVLSKLVRYKLLDGKGNHGVNLMQFMKESAPRYTKTKRNDAVNKVLMRLYKYAPSNINELGCEEPDFLITPIPLVLVYGHFGIGLGAGSTIPAFTYESLVTAYRNQDYRALRPQYGLDMIEPSEVKELWETGYGRITYKMKVTYEWSEEDGCNVTVIEGDGTVFQPNLSELNDHIEAGRVWVRDESTKHIRLVIGRYPRVRAVSDDEVYEISERAATFSKVYDCKVAVAGKVKRVSIKDWLDVTHGLYDDAHTKWQNDSTAELRTKLFRTLLIPHLVDIITQDGSDEELIAKGAEVVGQIGQWFQDNGLSNYPTEVTAEDIDAVLKMPIRRIRTMDLQGTLQKYLDQIEEVMSFSTEHAIDDAAATLKL